MNRTQLLEIIESALQSASAAGGQATATSLSRVMRDAQAVIATSRDSVTAPQLPLPTAECVACFVEGNASEGENAHVVRASVHDAGILLQVVNAVQSLDERPQQPSQQLISRLLDLRETQRPEPTGLEPTPLVDAELVSPERRSAEAVAPATLPTDNGRRPSYASSVVVQLTTVAAIAACLLLAVGWFWGRTSPPVAPIAHGEVDSQGTEHADDRRSEQRLAVSDRNPDSQGAASVVQANSDALWQHEANDIDAAGPAIAAESLAQNDTAETNEKDEIEDALNHLEQQITAQRDVVDSGGIASESTNLPANNSAIASNDGSTMRPNPMDTQGDSIVSERSEPTIAWTQITGILARQEETGYDKWKVVSKADLSRNASSDTAQLAQNGSNSWLTLPTCYARGKLAGGGQIVMGQDTNVSARSSTDRTTDFNLKFGSLVLLDVPKGTRLRFPGLDSQMEQFDVRAPARLHVRRILGGIQVSVDSGDVVHQGKSISVHRLVTIRRNSKEFGATVKTLPKWATELPKNAALPRHILANIGGSGELSVAIDKQLVSLARNLKANNRKSMANFRNLCRWRAKLSVEDSTSVTRHPLWFVRSAMFDMVVSNSDHLPSLAVRRVLVAKLQSLKKTGGDGNNNARNNNARNNNARNANALSIAANNPRATQGIQRFRNWFEMAKGTRQPNRQDVAEWLNLLANDDAVIAAFADYLLRKRFSGGPNFDPTATAARRADAQKLWRTLVRGSDRATTARTR